jgi:hypothetical protein
MGEQRAVDTVRDFVKTTWGSDEVSKAGDAAGSQVWNKPDTRTGSLELRRITTHKSKKGGAYPLGVRTDFYELDWGDLTGGSTWQQFVGLTMDDLRGALEGHRLDLLRHFSEACREEIFSAGLRCRARRQP